MEDLEVIIQRMIDAGESEESIKLVIEGYDDFKLAETEKPGKKKATDKGASVGKNQAPKLQLTDTVSPSVDISSEPQNQVKTGTQDTTTKIYDLKKIINDPGAVKDYFKAVDVSEDEVFDNLKNKFFAIDKMERPVEYFNAIGPGAYPTEKFLNSYETDLKNYLTENGQLEDYEKAIETGVIPVDEDAIFAAKSEIKYKKAKDYFGELTSEDRAGFGAALKQQQFEIKALGIFGKEVNQEATKFETNWADFINKRESIEKQIALLENKNGNKINNLSSEEDIKEYNNLVSKLNSASEGIDIDAFKVQQKELLDNIGILNTKTDELMLDSDSFIDIGVGAEALRLNYSLISKAVKGLEKDFLGTTARYGASALEILINDDNVLLDTKVKLLEEDAKQYYKSLARQLDEDFYEGKDIADVKTGDDFIKYAGNAVASNSTSVVLALLGGGVAGAGRQAIKGATTLAAKKIAINSLKTNAKLVKDFGTAVFFSATAGDKFAREQWAKEDASTALPALYEAQKNAKYTFQKEEIQNRIDFYNDKAEISTLKSAISSLAYGTFEGIGERFGSLSYVQNIGNLAKIAGQRNFVKKLLYGGAQIGKTVAIEEAEEIFTKLGQNWIDKTFLKENKSLFEGIDKDFFAKTAITSMAIGGPAHTGNLFSIVGSEINNIQNIQKNKKLADELINITNNLKYSKIGSQERNLLNNRRREIIKDAALGHMLNLHSINKLSQTEIEQVFDISRQQNNIITSFYEVGSSSMPVELKKKRKRELEIEYQKLDKSKSGILKIEEEGSDKYNQAYTIGLFDFATDITLELLPKGSEMIFISQEDANKLSDEATNDREKEGFKTANAFIKNGNIYINKNVIKQSIADGNSEALYSAVSPLHELLHLKLAKDGLSIGRELKTIIKGFGETTKKIFKEKLDSGALSKEGYDSAIARMDSEGYKNNAEEALVLLSDLVNTGMLSLNDFDANYEIRNLFNSIVNKVSPNFNLFAKLDTTSDIVNYIKNYTKGINSNRILLGDEEENKTAFSLPTDKQTVASEKVQKLYEIYNNPETSEAIKSRVEGDIVSQFMGSVNKIVSGYRDRPGFKTFEEDLVVDVVTQAGGLLTLIRKYDPSKNDSLAAFVNTYLKVRAIPIINKTLGIDEASTFKSDVTEVKDVTATESAEDSINASEEIAKEKPKKEKVKLKDKLNFDKELNEIISKNLVKSIALNVKKFDETSTKNRTISPFVADIKMDLANFLEKDIAKNIKETGAESFLIENRDILLDNFTTTFLAKHPFFRKGILKRVNGVWTPPVRISEYLYKWVDKNGNALKIDRDNASERGLTSGPEFIKRNPDIKTVLKENEFVDYHFQDGALRKKIKSNPISSVARQIASEYSLEILQEDLLKEGPLTEELRQRADLVGVVMATNDTIEIAKSIDRGLIKFSSTLSKGAYKSRVAELEEFMFVNMAKGVDFVYYLTENTKPIPPEHKSRVEEFKNKFNSLVNLINISRKSNGQFKWFKDAGYKYIGSKNDALESIENRLKELIQSKSNAWLHSKKSMQKAYGLTDTSLLTLNKRNFIESANAFYDAAANSLIEENASKEKRMAAANFMVSLGAGRKVQNMSSYWKNNFFPLLKKLGIEKEYTLIALQPFNGKNGKKVFPFTIGDKNGKKIKIITTQETISGEIQTSIQNAKMNINVEAQNAQSDYAKEAIAFFEKYMIKGLHGEYPSIAPSHLFVLVKAMQADMSSAIKVLAPVSFIYLNESRDYQDYTFEHMIAANTVGNYLINHILQNTEKSKNELANVIKYYKVAIVPTTFANIVDKFYKSSLESGFDILGYLYDARYFAEAVKAYAEEKGIIVPYNMESFISVENTPKGDALPRNKTIKENKTLYSISLPQPQSHKSMNSTINEMIERKEGVLATEVISTQTAQLQGRPKGKLDVFVPPSAEDFLGLLYKFLGAGKQGDADMAFFKGKLLRPIARASFLLNLERQALKAKYASLIKNNKGILPLLREESVYKYYSNDHAVRVFMWDKLGYDIPGLSETDKTALIKAVKSSPKLLKFASEAVSIPNKKESWLKPNEYWAASNLESDLQETISKTGRARLFNEFIENSKIIFSKDNLNKIEAIYGQDFRSNLEDIIYRISKGKSREIGSKNKITNTLLNWIRGSVATTMFLNTRTAVTQQLSFVNFMNWSDNNPLEAGKAFANTKQWAKDWAFLFNSDWMKERRQGLKTDINESELIAALQGTNNRYAALMRTVLSKGFIFTKYGDNIAVANGGASFYRNRINKYIKEGKSESQAQKLAFLDFQEIAEETQQSTRQDLLSNQQVTVAGRLFLAFANTSMQYTRLTKKAALDLINGRGDWKSNVSKIVFYSTVQNIIFSALQNALFAVTFWDDDDIDKDKMIDAKTERVINNVVDGLLKGTGITGSIVATLKNVVIRIMKEQEKGWKGNDAYILLEVANIAPPVGIKARKLYGAYTNYKFNKGLMDYIGYDNPKHPAYQITGAVASGAFNIPLDRLISKVSNLKDATGSEAEAWQRIALVAGWGGWELGMKDAETEKARATKGKGAEEGRTSTRTSTRKSTRKSTRE